MTNHAMITLDDILAITGNRVVFEALTKLMSADKPADRAKAWLEDWTKQQRASEP